MTGPDAPVDPTRVLTPAFLALTAAGIAFFVAGGVVLPVTPRYATEVLGADEAGLGVAIGSFSIAALILRPAVGWSSDRYGRRPLLVIGAVLAAVALVLHLAAGSLPILIAARSLLGTAEAFFLVAMLASGSDLAPPHRRGEALSLLSLSLYLGVAIGPPLGEVLRGAGSYAAVWVGAAALAALSLVLTIAVPETAPVARQATRDRRRTPLIHPAGLLPGAISFLGLIGMAAFFTFLPVYGVELGLDGVAVPLVLYATIVIVLRVVGATWPDRFGAVRVSGAALVIGAVGLLVMGLAPGGIVLIAGTAVFATGVAFLVPALLAVAVSLVPPEERGTVVGTASVFWDLSLGAGPVALGLVAARGGYGAAFVVAAAVSLAGAALLVARRASLETPGRSAATAPGAT